VGENNECGGTLNFCPGVDPSFSARVEEKERQNEIEIGQLVPSVLGTNALNHQQTITHKSRESHAASLSFTLVSAQELFLLFSTFSFSPIKNTFFYLFYAFLLSPPPKKNKKTNTNKQLYWTSLSGLYTFFFSFFCEC
jgi:hypothetical protein